MNKETPHLIDNFSPNTLLATLQKLLPNTSSWDIATGNFDIGALLVLDKLWQPLKPIRILIGDETTHRTRNELLNALAQQADESIEISKERDDFTTAEGLEAVREALKSRQIYVRIYKNGSESPAIY
jgi:hypothetical protein